MCRGHYGAQHQLLKNWGFDLIVNCFSKTGMLLLAHLQMYANFDK